MRIYYTKDDITLINRDKTLFNTLVQKALDSDDAVEKGDRKKHKHHYLKHSCGTEPYEYEF